MDKQEFRDLVIPLNEKEKYYKANPQEAGNYFGKGGKYNSTDHDAVITISYPMMMSSDGSLMHGALLPIHTEHTFSERALCFNKQTRYSVVPLHRHTYIEMSYVYTGHCTSIVNDCQFELQEGDVIIMDSGVIHNILPTKDEDIVINCLMERQYFSSAFIERMESGGAISRFLSNALSESRDHNHYLFFHMNSNPLFRELMENAFCEYLDPGVCCGSVIDSYMNLIFIELARCYQGAKEKEYRLNRRSYPTEVLRYMDEHCTTCTLEEVAGRFGYHPNYLSRMIRESTGSSFKSYITDRRLSRAAFLLANTDEPVSTIARKCGYTNQNFFYHKFSEKYGCTPAQCRARQ